jgi:transposase-like protein
MIYGSDISSQTTHRKTEYLNNIIERDHRIIKIKPMLLGFKSLVTVEKIICGIVIMHMVKKG